MSGLVLFLLLVIAAVYGVFFLIFKGIWLLLKKHANKWPLILAAISTVLSGLMLVGLILWGIGTILKPFRPMQQRWQQNPQPIYGVRTYTDPVYHFTLQLPDGMDYSEWMDFDGMSLKLGINTNLFKKDASGEKIQGPVVLSMLLRQTKNIQPEQPFAGLEEELRQQSNQRRLDLQQNFALTIDGYPAYYATGTAYSNRGPVPFWLQAIYQDGAIIYAVSTQINDKQNTGEAAQMIVSSLHPALLSAPQAAN